MNIVIHAGHNPDGKVACGAVGFEKESTLAREVCAYLPEYLLKYEGISSVTDVTCNNGKNSKDILNKVIGNTNASNPDLSVSVHLNASASPSSNGTEVWYYTGNNYTGRLAESICLELSKYGYKNRGAKPSVSLAVLKRIKCDSILVECAFVTSRRDMSQFSSRQVAKRIAKGIAKHYNLKEIKE